MVFFNQDFFWLEALNDFKKEIKTWTSSDKVKLSYDV